MTNAASVSARPLVFFHVMKCGGTSVRRSLSTSAPRGRDDVFALDGSAANAAVGGLLMQEENWRFRGELLAYLLHAGAPPVVVGHFRYTDALAEFATSADFVTLLRPPVDRVVSLYRYRRFSGREGAVEAPARIGEILDDPHWVAAGHHYVDTFCGDPSLDPRSDQAIDAAVENLSRFRVVGEVAEMADFVRQISAVCGRPVDAHRENASPARGEPDDGAAELREELGAVCAPDQRVYDQVFSR